MIVELLMSFFFALVRGFVGLLPTVGPPAWLMQLGGHLAPVWEAGAGLGAWVPWSLVGIVLGTVLACVFTGLTVRLVRIVASFFTAGGGSAG